MGTRVSGGKPVPRNKRINASVKKAPDALRNWPRSGALPSFPPTPTYLGMDLAGLQGVVRVRDAGTPRAPEAGNRGGPPAPPAVPPRPPPIQDQLSPWGAQGGGRWAAGPGARAMAGGDGGRREGRRGWGGREKPAARTSGGRRRSWSARRAGGRERGAPGPGPGPGALRGPSGREVAGEDRAAAARGRGSSLARLGSRLRPRARGAGSARGGGCGGARAPGGAGTCGGGETELRRVRGKAVLILTPNVFGESCRRGTLEGGGVEATDRLTAAAGEPPLLARGQEAPSLAATPLKIQGRVWGRVLPRGLRHA